MYINYIKLLSYHENISGLSQSTQQEGSAPACKAQPFPSWSVPRHSSLTAIFLSLHSKALSYLRDLFLLFPQPKVPSSSSLHGRLNPHRPDFSTSALP